LRIKVTPRRPRGAASAAAGTSLRAADLVDHRERALVQQVLVLAAEQVGAEHHARHLLRHQEIDGAGHLVVASRRVEHDARRRHLERVAQADRPVPLAVGVDHVGEVVAAVGHQRAEALAHRGAAAFDQLAQRIEHARLAEAAEQLEHPPFAESHGGDRGAQIAGDHRREARVADEDPHRLLVAHAFALEPHRRHDRALLEDVGALGRQRAGPQATDIVEMRPGMGKATSSPSAKTGAMKTWSGVCETAPFEA
jgi:hypothetical protein